MQVELERTLQKINEGVDELEELLSCLPPLEDDVTYAPLKLRWIRRMAEMVAENARQRLALRRAQNASKTGFDIEDEWMKAQG